MNNYKYFYKCIIIIVSKIVEILKLTWAEFLYHTLYQQAYSQELGDQGASPNEPF